jgi:Protein of unknown function (DUF1015).
MNRDIGVSIPEIFLPADNVDLSRWAVVACDQYTSQPDYWENVDGLTNGVPSTYHITLPEIYLESKDCEDRIKKINATMEKYVEDKSLVSQGNCFILVKRKTSRGNERTGLILAVDLEKYDYKKGSGSLIRATEGTVEERLPPRVKVRQNALLELPHIMLLIDDPGKTVIEPLSQNIKNYEKLYDFDLMMDGGRIQGYKVSDQKSVEAVLCAIENLADPEKFINKYSLKKKADVLLFAAGDGNHSLATAKVHWENVKKNLNAADLSTHPSRYALVELINIHDSGLIFEPIHRVVFGAGIELVSKYMEGFCKENKCIGTVKYLKAEDDLEKLIGSGDGNTHIIPFVSGSKKGYLEFKPQPFNLEVATTQKLLDYLSSKGEKIRIDYIHGSDIVYKLGSQEDNTGLFLPPMDKSKLFKTVIQEGALVKKTFSMGEADEKRYYLECRKIK